MLDNSQTIDFLKLDVEGAELACLEGARKLLEYGNTKGLCD
ncbi:FkbM family methyltransferase [Rhodoplanes elegans]|nr:FkbM family methyltransferase [Rhodoplanes elegans]